MLKKILIVVILLLGFKGVGAEELEKESFLYTQDFEKTDPVKVWTLSKHKLTIDFKGLTEEKAYSGKNSFKLDVTFHESCYFYWYIPIKVPAEGKLNFSARIFLGEETTGRAALGAGVTCPAGSGCWRFDYGEKGEWKLIEKDLVKFSQVLVKTIIRGGWAVGKENVGVYVNRIGIFLYGKKGERIVVYVDDIKIEGEIPTEEAYEEDIEKRWTPAKERISEKISLWEKTLEEKENKIASFTNLSPESEKMKKDAEAKIASLKKKVERIKKKGSIPLREQKEIDLSLENLTNMLSKIKLSPIL
ncbi:hypothetical protein KKC91_01085 [bacterium]|nr:hypothetical protein [bacterium]